MIPELQQLGFTRNEANVYLAALQLQKCSVQQLAYATGIKRLTVHSIVEKFEAQQIFLRTYEGKRRRVTPVEPRQLLRMVHKEAEEVRYKEQVLSTLLPRMEELYRSTQRGLDVKVLTGQEGFAFIAEDVLNAQTEFLEYANIDALTKTAGDQLFGSFLPKKHQRKIPSKFLYPDTPAARAYIRKNYMEKPGAAPMEAKFLKAGSFPFHDSLIVMYDDKVAFMKASSLSTVIIKDAEISASLRSFYLLFWDQAGEAMRNF